MKVISIKKIEGAPWLRATVIIELYGNCEVRGFSIIEERDGKLKVLFPEVRWIRQGMIHKQELLKLKPDLRKMIKTEILAAWDAFQIQVKGELKDERAS
jgi:hypothetical protein